MLKDERERGLLTKLIREAFKFSIFIGLLLAAIYSLGYWPLFLQLVEEVKNHIIYAVELIGSVF